MPRLKGYIPNENNNFDFNIFTMKTKRKMLSLMATVALTIVGYFGSQSYFHLEDEYSSLLSQNIEALTINENDLLQLKWKAMHGPCYRSGFVNGVITPVENGQIYGYSIADPNGSDKPHEHGCTFYCPDFLY